MDETIAGAVLFARPDLATIAVTGADARSWLNGLVTSDLNKVGPEVASYGLVLTKMGRILADAWVVAAEERLLVGVQRGRVALIREHFEAHLMMEDAAHEDASAQIEWALLVGAKAAEIARGVRFSGEVDVLGLGGAALAAPSIALEGVSVGTEEQWEALRVRRCFPGFGVDYGENHMPHEASLEKRAVSFTKGCYLGQEVVARTELQGQVKRKIVAIEISAPKVPVVGDKVRSKDGAKIGTVTSAAGAMALAMVPIAFAGAGTAVDVGGAEAQVIAV